MQEKLNKIKIHIDTVSYKEKPKINEIKKISNRITKKEHEVSPKELAEKIVQGYSILPALMDGNRSKVNFKECQIVLLDFDNSYKKDGSYYKITNYISFNDMQKNPFIQKNASFMYSTHSSTDEINRYRVVFILDKVVQTEQEFIGIINYLLHKFPTADTSCKDVSRLFFSGKNIVEINFNNTLSTNYCIPENMFVKESYIHENAVELPINYKDESNSYLDKINHIDFTDNRKFNCNANKTKLTHVIKNRIIIKYRNSIINELDIDLTGITSKKDMIYFINSLDLSILLDVPYGLPFKCVLTEDKNPSASIFKVPDTSMYLYKRFGHEGFVLNVLDVFRVLLHTNSKDTVINFFMKVFNITYAVPKNLYHTYNVIQQFVRDLNNPNVLKTLPAVNKVLGKHKNFITDYIQLILLNPYEDKEKNEVRYLTAKSAKTICELLTGSYSMNKRIKISTLNNLLSYLNIFKKLDETEYPKSLKNYLKKYQLSHGSYKLQTILEIKIESTVDYISYINTLEQHCQFLLDRGYTFSGFSQDFISIADSITESNRLYKQTQNKKISKHYITMLTDITNILKYHFKILTTQYLLVDDLKTEILKTHTKNNVKINFNKTLAIALENLSLQKKKASNSIKDEFDIEVDADRFPYIIINK